jgi:hypothetical protein
VGGLEITDGGAVERVEAALEGVEVGRGDAPQVRDSGHARGGGDGRRGRDGGVPCPGLRHRRGRGGEETEVGGGGCGACGRRGGAGEEGDGVGLGPDPGPGLGGGCRCGSSRLPHGCLSFCGLRKRDETRKVKFEFRTAGNGEGAGGTRRGGDAFKSKPLTCRT